VCEGFKFEEIASILDVPASTIKSRVYSALEAMRVVLAPIPEARGVAE
jgi:RNA polymerase sigma-70 factor (ECF subfamily)